MKHPRKFMSPVLLRIGVAAGLVMSSVLTGIGAAGTASASTGGEACLFNAPYGVIGTGTVGHVGYGFRNGTGDNWTYGATEGTGAYVPSPSTPADTKSWHLTGTWAQMLQTFGNGEQPNGWGTGSGYYIEYRCTMVASSDPTTALDQVKTSETNGYLLSNNNCLTKSVVILQAYGVPNLPAPGNLEYPNEYFQSKLPSYPSYNPGFNGIQWFTTLKVGVNLVDAQNGAYLTRNPSHKTRPMHVQIFNASNQLVYDSDPGWNSTTNHSGSSIKASVVPGTDKYQATFQLPGGSPNLIAPSGCIVTPCDPGVWSDSNAAGAYQVKVQLDFTLLKYAPGIVLISQGVPNDNTVSDTNLIVGDISQDNQVNLTDYNLVMNCYSDLLPPRGPCPAWQQTASDLNDDGHVNGVDYNIMLRIFQNHGGA